MLPFKISTDASEVSGRFNHDPGMTHKVAIVDLTRYIFELDKDIDILKIDVEGAEVDLLRDLLDTGIAKEIPFIFVETHEQKIPSITKELTELINRIEVGQLGGLYKNIYLNWI